MIMIVYLQVPLLLKEIESKTEDSSEKMTIKKILQMKESSLSNTVPCRKNTTNKINLSPTLFRRLGWQNEMVEEFWAFAWNTTECCLARSHGIGAQKLLSRVSQDSPYETTLWKAYSQSEEVSILDFCCH